MTRRAALLTAFVLLLAARAGAQEPPPLPPGAIAVVGSRTITKKDLEAETIVGSPAQALQRLIDRAIIEQGMRRDGGDLGAVKASQIDEELGKLEAQDSPVPLKLVLERTGQTREQFKSTLRLLIALRTLVERTITKERLEQLYAERALLIAGEVRASQICVKIEGRGTKAAKARALELLQRLSKVEGDLDDAFAKLAIEASDDPLAPLTAGDLDWLQARGMATPERSALVQAAFTQGKRGLVPEPVRTEKAYYVMFVSEVRLPKSVTFEALRERLLEEAIAYESSRRVNRWKASTLVRTAPDAPRPAPPGRR